MTELEQFKIDFARIVDTQYIEHWLNTPNPAFNVFVARNPTCFSGSPLGDG